MKATPKSQLTTYFQAWLTLMEDAYHVLDVEEFRKLENKIKAEIAFYRKRKKKK